MPEGGDLPKSFQFDDVMPSEYRRAYKGLVEFSKTSIPKRLSEDELFDYMKESVHSLYIVLKGGGELVLAVDEEDKADPRWYLTTYSDDKLPLQVDVKKNYLNAFLFAPHYGIQFRFSSVPVEQKDQMTIETSAMENSTTAMSSIGEIFLSPEDMGEDWKTIIKSILVSPNLPQPFEGGGSE